MVVEKGDKIFVPSNQITSTEITVEWKEGLLLSDKRQQYYSVPFTNKDKGTQSAPSQESRQTFHFADDTLPSQEMNRASSSSKRTTSTPSKARRPAVTTSLSL
jgi:hypothetical protein